MDTQLFNHYGKISVKSLWRIGLLAIITAVAANAAIRIIAVSFLDISSEFIPLQWESPVIFSAIGTLMAVVVFAIINRFAKQPKKTFIVVASIVLFLSFIPDVLILTDLEPNFPGTTVTAVAVLMIMHVVAAIISVGMLTNMTQTELIHGQQNAD